MPFFARVPNNLAYSNKTKLCPEYVGMNMGFFGNFLKHENLAKTKGSLDKKVRKN
jgi:hypothetical protein